jgi:hypothetical protein
MAGVKALPCGIVKVADAIGHDSLLTFGQKKNSSWHNCFSGGVSITIWNGVD